IESRINYRRAIKMAIQSSMRAGAEGIKVRVSGRLNGSDMARTEEYKEGRTPLHTFRADIDYVIAEALTVYGLIGLKVWICKGEVLGKRDLSPNVGVEKKAVGGGMDRDRGSDRRREGGRDGGGRDGGQGRKKKR
ncbi:MAG TPA: 30S ribosomal protein S3, partial [Saprospiraceae bacterium]|nr:30S ribosomal protein S3 [Saprospiraceae bacterium]